MYRDIDTDNSSPENLEALRDELPNHIDNNLDLILGKLHAALDGRDYEIEPSPKESITRGEQEDADGRMVQDYGVHLMISVEDDTRHAYIETMDAVAAAVALDVVEFGWINEGREWMVMIDFGKHCRRYC